MAAVPPIISVDDHIVEPPGLWVDRMPARYRDAVPHVVHTRAKKVGFDGMHPRYEFGAADGVPADVWHIGDRRVCMWRNNAAVDAPFETRTSEPMTYAEMRPACYQPADRLLDMDVAGVQASLCFPNTVVRFCGQLFLEMPDKELALALLRVYNDFVVQEWAGPSGGRLIPLTVVPLWDPELAAQEVYANAARGVRAVSFSELPTNLGLPSIHSGHWDPFVRACDETGTVICIHIGSGSRMPNSSADAPLGVVNVACFMYCGLSMLDWLFSGLLVRFPNVRLCYAESQVGWLPYMLERADSYAWERAAWTGAREVLPEKPSFYFRRQVHTAFFDDPVGMELIEHIGAGNILFETDYPHGDSSWPHSRKVVESFAGAIGPQATERIVRGNAIELFGLDL
jgi:predicted TIM-barrel fold metal-dependent hydrolase